MTERERYADYLHRKRIFDWRKRESRRVIRAYHRGEKTRQEAEEELNRKKIPFISL